MSLDKRTWLIGSVKRIVTSKIDRMQNKIMMRLTIGSEAIFFISLMIAYAYFWQSGHFGQAATSHLDIFKTGVFTFLLISSSFCFYRAERAHRNGKTTPMVRWLLATVLLGFVFLAGQAHEYYGLLKQHLSISSSEFGSSFYALTGFHALHVLIGLVLISILLALSVRGYLSNSGSSLLATVGIYWHFVDVVWLCVFTLIYVLPYCI